MAITITFQDLSPNNMWGNVQPAPSGSGWGSAVYPISGWQQGQNPSGAVVIRVSGYSGYVARVYPSGAMETPPFSSDVTVTLALFTTTD